MKRIPCKAAQGDGGVRPAGGRERYARGRACALAAVPWSADQGHLIPSTRTKLPVRAPERAMTRSGVLIAGGSRRSPGAAGAEHPRACGSSDRAGEKGLSAVLYLPIVYRYPKREGWFMTGILGVIGGSGSTR